MADEGFKRKLTSILSADAVGYSRLMEDDEEATVSTLTSYREVITTLIKQHNGIVIDSPGDNILADFVSVVDAVQCAVSVQNELNARNENLPENRRMDFRIGINLGDVIQEGERIYGDGVNIAARLEGLATKGGICISKTAFDQIERKLPYGYEYMGDQTVKNISKPVGAYRVLMKPDAAGKVIGEKRFLGRYSRRTAMAAIIILVTVAVGLVSWNIYLHKSKKVEPASVERMAYPLPDKPSIAVMPFVNLSGNPEQEYLPDGISENIISTLSKLPTVFVIARGSTFAYKGKAVKIKQVSEELGVRYVVEGGVQRSDDRIRITAQLIDAIKGHHLWSERYDRNLRDIFALQDEISLNILKALQLKIPEAFLQGAGGGTYNLDAYLKFLQGLDYHFRASAGATAERSKSEYEWARRLYEEAISLDPKYADAYCGLGFIYLDEAAIGLSDSPEESFKKAYELAEKTLSLNSSLPGGHSLLAWIYLYSKQHDEAIAASKRAIDLDPNSAFDIAIAGSVLTYSGKFEEAISLFEKSMRLDPYAPEWVYHHFSNAYHLSGQFQQSIPLLKEAAKRWPNGIIGHCCLAVSYSAIGRSEEAREALEIYKKTHPECINLEYLEWYLSWLPLKNQSDKDRLMKLYLKAGLAGDILPSKSD